DTREGIRRGGDTGPAVVPFQTEESLLLAAIRHEDGDLEMPPKYPLDAETVAAFEKWIAMGAPDPREKPADGAAPRQYTNTIDLEKGRGHWAYQKPKKPAVPPAADPAWASHPIDAFIAAGHADKGLVPSPEADRATLLRRLSFDLAGLPPGPVNGQQSTVNGPGKTPSTAHGSPFTDEEWLEIVDHLLASPAFGERWGRHWLDVARYAESSGREINATYPQAWRYRDYVIDSF